MSACCGLPDMFKYSTLKYCDCRQYTCTDQQCCHKITEYDDEIEVGTYLGKYYLSSQIGLGCTGVLFKGLKYLSSKKMVAVKKIHISSYEENYQHVHEIKKLTNGQKIFEKILETIFFRNDVYLVKSYHTGMNIKHLSSVKGKLQENQLRDYTAEIISAVKKLHKLGIIYLNLKPQNIIVDSTDHIVLTDLGSSVTMHCKEELEEEHRTIIDEHTDWWCLGILWLELMGDEFVPVNVKNIGLQRGLLRHRHSPQPPKLVLCHLSSEAQDFVTDCLDANVDSDPSNHFFFGDINWTKSKGETPMNPLNESFVFVPHHRYKRPYDENHNID